MVTLNSLLERGLKILFVCPYACTQTHTLHWHIHSAIQQLKQICSKLYEWRSQIADSCSDIRASPPPPSSSALTTSPLTLHAPLPGLNTHTHTQCSSPSVSFLTPLSCPALAPPPTEAGYCIVTWLCYRCWGLTHTHHTQTLLCGSLSPTYSKTTCIPVKIRLNIYCIF